MSTAPSLTVAIADDDRATRELLQKMLENLGHQVVAAAREKDPTTEIIVLTAYGEMENVYQALKLGANQYRLHTIE